MQYFRDLIFVRCPVCVCFNARSPSSGGRPTTAQARPATASSFAASKPPPQPQLASSQWQSSLPARPATAGVRRANQGGSSASGAPFSDVQFMTATGRSSGGGGGGSTQQTHAAAANDAEDLGETIDMNDEQPPETTATPSTKLVGHWRFLLMCPLFLFCLLTSFCICKATLLWTPRAERN
jgi:hypothetical protein